MDKQYRIFIPHGINNIEYLGRWFSMGTPVSSTNKADGINNIEYLFLVE
jgi:hypothetical protein